MAKIKKQKKPYFFAFAVFFAIVSLFLLSEENKKTKAKVLGLQIERKKEEEVILKWEQLLAERPQYRDGWIQLGNLYYKIGDLQKAKETIQKVKQLDPNNEEVLLLEKYLEEK